MSELPIVAIMYDFDRTLCTKDMQDYSFIPSLGMTESEFWQTTNEMWQSEHMDSVLAYMYAMVKISKDKGVPVGEAIQKEFIALRDECGLNYTFPFEKE